MKCPTCTDTPLVMAERQGVEIDYCPTCRGIWLDRGELDKLLDRAVASASVAAAPQQTPLSNPATPRQQDDRYYHEGHGDRDHYKRKKSWLHEIFD